MEFEPIGGVMVFNATFNNISVISWLSILEWRLPNYSYQVWFKLDELSFSEDFLIVHVCLTS